MRNDNEALPGREEIFQSNIVLDWDDVLKIDDCASDMYRTFKLYKWMMRRLRLPFDKNLSLWRKNSWRIVETGAKLFSRYDTIFTDRLHGMIFAVLLNRKFEILDKSYHKVSGYKT